jgi:hypothetical protein
MKLGRRGGHRTPPSKRALLQHVNRELLTLSVDGATLEVYCECGRDECIISIDVPRDDLAAARAHPRSAIVVPEHKRRVESVLEQFASFLVVTDLDAADPDQPLDADRVPDGLEL